MSLEEAVEDFKKTWGSSPSQFLWAVVEDGVARVYFRNRHREGDPETPVGDPKYLRYEAVSAVALAAWSKGYENGMEDWY